MPEADDPHPVSERWTEWRAQIDLDEYHTRWTRRAERGIDTHGEADLRYKGQSFELAVPLHAPDLAEAFHAAHEERYGYCDRSRAIELVAVRTAEITPGPELRLEQE